MKTQAERRMETIATHRSKLENSVDEVSKLESELDEVISKLEKALESVVNAVHQFFLKHVDTRN